MVISISPPTNRPSNAGVERERETWMKEKKERQMKEKIEKQG